MSARVLNPAMMTEISRNLGSGGGDGGGGGGGGRAAPSRAALARVRRDLFGPVDHAAARALAERELRAQSLLDAERWGFDFHLEIPRANSRYEWELVTEHDVVPEPYALRGMPYLRKHAPDTPRKLPRHEDASATSSKTTTATTTITTAARIMEQMESTPDAVAPAAERTPPQEPRVPEIGASMTTTTTTTTTMKIMATATTTTTTTSTTPPASQTLDGNYQAKRKRCAMDPTTPVLPPAARKQSAITDFMKSRKRGLNGTTKSMIEPPEKMARNAGQIRS